MSIGRGGGVVLVYVGIVLRRHRAGYEREVLSSAVHTDGIGINGIAIRAKDIIFLARQHSQPGDGADVVCDVPRAVHLDL